MSATNIDPVISSTDYKFRVKDALLGGQMIFVAFGALVLVPIIMGIDPNVALFTAGVGTLIFQIVTGGKVPVFVASSFAFIAPVLNGVSQGFSIAQIMSGLAAAGIFYIVLSFVIKTFGADVLLKILPPIVTGPIIMVIGLSLAPIAVGWATKAEDGAGAFSWTVVFVSTVALVTTILVAILGKGTLKLIPILVGIFVGYIVALIVGMVDFAPISNAPLVALPAFVFPQFHLPSILAILPVAIAPAIEHFGDVLAISSVTGKDYIKDPGVDRTLLGDGLATSFAALLGGPPNTTYSEVTGAVTLTKAFNPAIMTWAAIFAVLLSFIGKLGAFLQTIPKPVMGGILIILFGAIMSVGMNSLVQAKVNLLDPRNLIIVATILVFGVGAYTLEFSGGFQFGGIALAGVVGVVLNWLLPETVGD